MIGRSITWLTDTSSTNDLAMRLRPGSVVVAAEQNSGRGQYGRAWQAPSGSSLLLSLAAGRTVQPAPVLTAWASVAVAEAVEKLIAVRPSLKWPNDLLVRGRKICGILIEQRGQTVLGIGLNLTQTAEDFAAMGLPQATSLAIESTEYVSRGSACQAVIQSLRAWEPTAGRLPLLEDAWRDRFGLVGHRVEGERVTGEPFAGVVAEFSFAGLTLLGQPRIPLEFVRRLFRPELQ